jgi:hypothetical protein
LVYAGSDCCFHGVVAMFVVAIYFDVDVVRFYFLLFICFIEPNGCDSTMQLSFDIVVFVYVSCLFGIDEHVG